MASVQHWWENVQDFRSRVDPKFAESFQLGLVVGLVVLSTLILFPGMYIQHRLNVSTHASLLFSNGVKKAVVLTLSWISFAGREPVSAERRERDNDDGAFATESSSPSAHKSVGRRAAASSSSQKDENNNHTSAWTPHQKLNFAVYLAMFAVTLIVLDNIYGGFVTTWFRIYFPREASFLGFTPLT